MWKYETTRKRGSNWLEVLSSHLLGNPERSRGLKTIKLSVTHLSLSYHCLRERLQVCTESNICTLNSSISWKSGLILMFWKHFGSWRDTSVSALQDRKQRFSHRADLACFPLPLGDTSFLWNHWRVTRTRLLPWRIYGLNERKHTVWCLRFLGRGI